MQIKAIGLKDYIDMSGEEYRSTINALKEDIMVDIDNRRKPVSLPYSNQEITTGNLLTSLILLEIFNKHNRVPLPENILDRVDITLPDTYGNYYNDLIRYMSPYIDEGEFTYNEVSSFISGCIDELSEFATQHVLYQNGSTISVFDMIKMEDNSQDLYDAMHFEDDPDEIRVDKWNVYRQSVVDKGIAGIKDNSYRNTIHDYMDSHTTINFKQMAEVMFIIGYKPDSFGKVIPIRIPRSYLTGLDNITEFFIDCVGARTALITSKNQVKKSGYFSRKLTTATSDLRISKDTVDCGSINYLTVKLSDQKTLNRFNGRYYKDPETGDLKVLNSLTDTNLIDQTLQFRSPIFCALNNDKICQTCYGDLAKRVKDISLGIDASLSLGEPLTQGLLSSKHLLSVKVDNIVLPDGFTDYFKFVNSTHIALDATENISFVIQRDNIEVKERRQNDRYSIDEIAIEYNKGRKVIHKDMKFDRRLIINDSFVAAMPQFYNEERDAYLFSSKDVSDNDIFRFVINNKGIADPLMRVKNIYEKNSPLEDNNYDVDLIMKDLLETIEQSGITLQSTHLESILRQMVFFDGDPKFNREQLALSPNIAYDVKNLTDSIMRSNSITRALSFQYLHKLLLLDSYDGYTKDGASMFDQLMM